MQALVRVQTRVCDQRRRQAMESAGSMNSTFTERHNSLGWHVPDGKSSFRDGSVGENWEDRQNIVDGINSMLLLTKEAALKRERSLAYATSDRIWRSDADPLMEEEKPEGRASEWLGQHRPRKQWERAGRHSCDQRQPTKIVEVDNFNCYTGPSFLTTTGNEHYHQNSVSHSFPSPLHQVHQNFYQKPLKSHQSEPKHVCVHSGSPRCLGVESATHAAASVPSYMAATASTKARARSHSAPRQRPLTPERERARLAKRQLFFGTINEVSSPSMRNMQRP
ncbi:hypothetical protein Ancab_008989 [Ancistrocladus abbreviatus]